MSFSVHNFSLARMIAFGIESANENVSENLTHYPSSIVPILVFSHKPVMPLDHFD